MSTNSTNKPIKPLIVGMAIGSILTFGAYTFMVPVGSDQTVTAEVEEKPLYWVAPMDANYRRDKAGKSPMGMDLVPVYDEGGKGPDEGEGTIRISPDVVNNLGVRTVIARFKPLRFEINTVGYVSFDEEKLVHIHPRVEGWVEKLYVKAVGDTVKKNAPLYDIYSPELVNAQEELLLALSRNNRQLINAAENRLKALQLPSSAIEKLIKTKEIQQKITFYAPQNGVVETLNIREGFFVKPGTTLLSIGDLSEVWLETEVFERQANQVKKGTPVTMTLDYLPGKTWQGKVDFIYPTLDAKTRTVKVRSRFSNEDGAFKPNMFAQIAIHTSGDEKALLIPTEALIRTGKQDRVVLALGEGSFKSIAVTVGRYDSESVEILTGISAGEKVVSSAQFLLDSESSKSSDFKRMHSNESNDEQLAPVSVWVQAKIESLKAEHKMLSLSHEAIPEWSWPEMVMDFIAIDTIDFSLLKVGLSLHVEVSKIAESDYIITNIHIPDQSTSMAMDKAQIYEVNSATVTGTINSLMVDQGIINISRSAIDKWNRPAATVNFITDKSVSLASFNKGMEVIFTFEIRDGNFIITDISPLLNGNKSSVGSSVEESPVDHSNH
jgi:Cu(I)/Ag(I) efflux system membrane fusion protein